MKLLFISRPVSKSVFNEMPFLDSSIEADAYQSNSGRILAPEKARLFEYKIIELYVLFLIGRWIFAYPMSNLK